MAKTAKAEMIESMVFMIFIVLVFSFTVFWLLNCRLFIGFA
jgi:hypothetical protein